MNSSNDNNNVKKEDDEMHNVQPFITEQRPLGFLVEILYKGVLLFHFIHLFAVMAFICHSYTDSFF